MPVQESIIIVEVTPSSPTAAELSFYIPICLTVQMKAYMPRSPVETMDILPIIDDVAPGVEMGTKVVDKDE